MLTLIDNNIEYLDELYKQFHVLSTEAAHLPFGSSTSSGLGGSVDSSTIGTEHTLKTTLVFVSMLLVIALSLVLAVCVNQRSRYERQLKAATVVAFGSSSPLSGLGANCTKSRQQLVGTGITSGSGSGSSATNSSGSLTGRANQLASQMTSASFDRNCHFDATPHLPNTNLHSQDPNPIWISAYGGGVAANMGSDDADDDIDSDCVWPVDDNIRRSLNAANNRRSAHINSKQVREAQANTGHHSDSNTANSNSENSSSSSTTNERKALCAAASSSQNLKTNNVNNVGGNVRYGTRNELPFLTAIQVMNKPNGKLANNHQQLVNKRPLDGASSTLCASFGRNSLTTNTASEFSGSTFGAYKEVTIYHPDEGRRLAVKATNNNTKRQISGTAQVANGKQQSSNNKHSTAPIETTNNKQTKSVIQTQATPKLGNATSKIQITSPPPPLQQQVQQQQQLSSPSSNGSLASIDVRRQQVQQQLKAKLTPQAQVSAHAPGQSLAAAIAAAASASQFESNLDKLTSIINLETTEL